LHRVRKAHDNGRSASNTKDEDGVERDNDDSSDVSPVALPGVQMVLQKPCVQGMAGVFSETRII